MSAARAQFGVFLFGKQESADPVAFRHRLPGEQGGQLRGKNRLETAAVAKNIGRR